MRFNRAARGRGVFASLREAGSGSITALGTRFDEEWSRETLVVPANGASCVAGYARLPAGTFVREHVGNAAKTFGEPCTMAFGKREDQHGAVLLISSYHGLPGRLA